MSEQQFDPNRARAPALILGSASPRRRALLAETGLPFNVDVASGVDEEAVLGAAGSGLLDVAGAARVATDLALRKARAVAVRRGDGTAVLGADTIVFGEGRLLGKPAGPEEAARMLRSLRGRDHAVITGVALATGTALRADHAATSVTMRDYAEAEIVAYIARGEPFDKAGAYAIQDPVFRPVARIRGCYPNVVGLPLCVTVSLLRRSGLPASVPADSATIIGCTQCPLRERSGV
jgi:MAF protein